MALLQALKQFTVKGQTVTGVFYREHETRNYGVNRDRLLVIRYTIGGKTRTESFGWLSEGKKPQGAQAKIAEFRSNYKAGSGATSLAEEELERQREQEVERNKQAAVERINITFGEFFRTVYFPQCQVDKAATTATTEELTFRHWIEPVIGSLRFNEISIDHLDKIKRNMLAGKRPPAKRHGRDRKPTAKDANLKRHKPKPMAARSIMYAMAIIRQVWNRACASNPAIAHGAWPGATKAFKKPKSDNMRRRFLTRNEVARLLAALQKKSADCHDMALLALHCGLRAGEVFNLTWDKVNLQKGELHLVDTKNGESRTAYLTDEVLAMLRCRSMDRRHPRIVFPTTDKTGAVVKHKQVPVTFAKTVAELGLNEGVTDGRDKIVFHTLRHTFASWLIGQGASLPVTRDLLGHKNLIMTSRYAHVSAEAQRNAIRELNRSLTPTGDNIITLHRENDKEISD
ncbi:MAG: site-specific integrase [Pelovirga sp.]